MSKKKALLLRISPELWEDLRRWADDELRSVNGHIEFLLRQTVTEHGRAKKQPPGSDRRAVDTDAPDDGPRD